jgi:2,5-diketo-D-gluconate reductase A
MPQIGLGTWPMNDQEAANTVAAAVQMGYRLIDTAENYQNETGVGEGLRRTSVPRDELFITSKFNREWHSVEGVAQACENSLKRLGLDYLDLLLVHWPNPSHDRYLEAYQGLVKLQESGKVRAIGVSNFKPKHLQRLLDAGFTPQVNQIQLDPYRMRADVVAFNAEHGIATETWSPIDRGSNLLMDPIVTQIAQQYSRTPAQVVLRWHTQMGYIPVPKSSNPERLEDNLSIFDFTLSSSDMQALSNLNRDDADILDADTFGH